MCLARCASSVRPLRHWILCARLYSTVSDLSSASDSRRVPRSRGQAPDFTTQSGTVGRVSVGALVSLCEDGHLEEVLQAVELVDQQSIGAFTTYRLYRLLEACIKYKHLAFGRRVYWLIVRRGFESSNFLGAHVMRMFAACGSLQEANQAFVKLPAPDVFAWAAIVSANAKYGRSEDALKLYRCMQQSSVEPNEYVFVAVLQACTTAAALAEGRSIHGHAREGGLELNVFVASALIDMYAKCGSLEDARQLFDRLSTKNLVSWTAMVVGYVQHGDGDEAIQLFHDMRRQGMHPDAIILSSVLKACSSVMALDQGKLIHADIMEAKLESDVFLSSALIGMYARCGSLEDARKVFDMSIRNLVSWNAMITGYVQHGNGQDALQLFKQMEQEGVQPDVITFSSTLRACATIAALQEGRAVHEKTILAGCESDPYISSTLIDMYAKCGSLEEAQRVFDRLLTRDTVIWTAMIAAYAQHGSVHQAIQLFQRMKTEGIEPTTITFVSLLSACSRAGLLDEAYSLFQSMSEDFGLTPGKEHFACIVDLLCRAGYLSEAEGLIKQLPSEPDGVVWLSLLAACQTHVNVELGKWAFKSIVQADPTNSAAYVMMANIYAAAGDLEAKVDIRNQMLMAGARKEPGRTWLELESQVHTFVVEDQDHPERKQIYSMLETVLGQINYLSTVA